MRKRVAITGVGAVTPVGRDAESSWASLIAGRSGIGRITTFPADTFAVRIAGLIKDFDLEAYVPDRKLRRRLSRAAGFGVAAALQAMRDAGAAPGGNSSPYAAHERGLSLGGSVGRPELEELAEWLYCNYASKGRKVGRLSPSSFLLRDQNVPVVVLGILADCQGPVVSVSTACSGSAHAIGEAFRHIQEGDARLMLAGGYDSLTTYLDVLGFSLLGALNTQCNDKPEKASRPFDRERSGFVLGEGAAMVVLEEWESARARGARIYAELVGYGSSLNAYRITDAPPDGGGAIRAMASALQEAGLTPADVDYVAAHGTSTPGNDLSETIAIKAVFGSEAHRLAISSPKSMTGHLTSGAGGLNLLAAVYAMRDEIVPPTINYEHPDPKLDLDYVPNQARRMPVRAAMVNAFAFGGTNAALVVRRPDDAEPAIRS